MIVPVYSKRTPPPPHRETLVSWVLGGTRLLAALFAAALVLASCEKPTDPGGEGTTGGGGTTKPRPASYTAVVKGTVRDSSGAPLPGATVSASTTPPVTTKTRPDGTFSFQVTHAGSFKFDLTVEKACYETATARSVTLTDNTPHDAGVTTLTLKPEPARESDRYTLTEKADGSYKLTVKECVTAIPASEFSTLNASAAGLTRSPILQRLATESGKAITAVLTEIELPSTLKTIEKGAFYRNTEVTGNLTIPRNVTTIGDFAFALLGAGNFSGRGSSNIASSQAPAITFETGSRLTDIGRLAFNSSGSKRALVLPEGLETIGNRAFDFFVMPAADLVIPGNVSSIGEQAFVSFDGINDGVTIRSAKLAKVGTTSPLGNNLFGSGTTGSQPRLSTITTIKLPASVYNSYLNTSSTPRSDLDAIFGSEITTSPNGYQDLEGNPHP